MVPENPWLLAVVEPIRDVKSIFGEKQVTFTRSLHFWTHMFKAAVLFPLEAEQLFQHWVHATSFVIADGMDFTDAEDEETLTFAGAPSAIPIPRRNRMIMHRGIMRLSIGNFPMDNALHETGTYTYACRHSSLLHQR
jgi:hypothetical protein